MLWKDHSSAKDPVYKALYRGHPAFGGSGGIPDGIVVLRPTASPAMVRDLCFSSVDEAHAYIASLPPGAAYDMRGVSPDDRRRSHPGEVFPWDYWPTEAECAG